MKNKERVGRIYFYNRKNSRLTYGEKTVSPEPGCYCKCFVKSGTGVIKIIFDGTPRVIGADYERAIFPITPFLKKRYDLNLPADCVKTNKATVCIGSVLLSMSTELGTDWEEMCSEKTVNGCFTSCTAEPIEASGTLASYNVIFETKDGKKVISMCDYASASNGFKEKSFSIFV